MLSSERNSDGNICIEPASPLLLSNKLTILFFMYFAEEKMSLNPNNYKLSDKTGKLLATGKITDIFFKFLIRIMPSLIYKF